MGSIALASPFQSLTDSLVVPNQSLPGIGSPIGQYKYTGSVIDFGLSAVGDAVAGSGTPFTSVPTDAIALEMWCNATGAGDYLFWSSRSGQLSNVGVLATNLANNTGATNPNRFVNNGQHLVIPCQSVGVLGSAVRFAPGTASARAQGRWIAAGSGFPYLMGHVAGSATEFVIAGAGASAQVPFSDVNRFPVGYAGLYMQITGTGVAANTYVTAISGTALTASASITGTAGNTLTFVGAPEVIVKFNFGYHSYYNAAGV